MDIDMVTLFYVTINKKRVTIMINTPRPIEDLAMAYSVIICEFEALERCFKLHKKLQQEYKVLTTADERQEKQLEINDCLTLFCVRARNLIAFFNPTGKTKPDDITLKDFNINPDQLNVDESFNDLLIRLHKEVAHFTYKRIKYYGDRIWNTDNIYSLIATSFYHFKIIILTSMPEIASLSLVLDMMMSSIWSE